MNTSAAQYRLGVDVGGTHTDLVLLDAATGAAAGREGGEHAEESRARRARRRGALRGARDRARTSIEFFAHGTTITTNALLEMRGAKVGLLITKGYPRRAGGPEPGARRQSVRLFLRQAAADRAAEPDAGDSRALRFPRARCSCRSTRGGAPRRARAARRPASNRSRSAICSPSPIRRTRRRPARSSCEEFPRRPCLAVERGAAAHPRMAAASTTLLNAYLEPVLVRYIAHLDAASIAAGLARSSVS